MNLLRVMEISSYRRSSHRSSTVVCEDMKWIELSQDRFEWRCFANMVMNIRAD
jgi:hypothetical protein